MRTTRTKAAIFWKCQTFINVRVDLPAETSVGNELGGAEIICSDPLDPRLQDRRNDCSALDDGPS